MKRALLTKDSELEPDSAPEPGECLPDGSSSEESFSEESIAEGSLPEAEEGGDSIVLLRRERFAAAVTAVIDGAQQIARLHAEQAARVELARIAGHQMHFTDSMTAGPTWSPDVVTERVIVTELAVALHLSETDARRLVETAEGLSGPFAATRAALEVGSISYSHAEVLVRFGFGLPAEALLDYESRLLKVATRVSVGRLKREARSAAEKAQATTAIDRHLAAAAERSVHIDPARDGMAYLSYYLPAVEAAAVYNRSTALARSLKNASDPRTIMQLRVDVGADLLLNGETGVPGAARGIRPHVRVTVPVLALLGRNTPPVTGVESRFRASEDFGMLEGYGPIDRLTALELTSHAPTFTRVLTDPITGCALTYGRSRYRPPADLDELIRTVHAECTFPLDCMPSASADLDHTRPWEEGGETAFSNISPLCSSHHKVKHHTAWQIQHDAEHPGTLIWTSPAGFRYVVEPTTLASPRFTPFASSERFEEGPPF